MKRHVLFIVLCIAAICSKAQTTSVFFVETVYTPLNGYEYYLSKLQPQTGASSQITQLPISGHYTGYGFFNCYNHYVFQGVDTAATPNGNINKLYEYDTLGNLIRTIPMDTSTGTWYKMCLPSPTSPHYYALRWNTGTGQYEIETIHALTGSRTALALPQLQFYTFLNSDATITFNDIIWMGMLDQTTGSDVMLRLNPINGSLLFKDTLAPGYYYDCLVYDCPNDTIYGFIAHEDSVQGAELFKIRSVSGAVIHTGITAIGPGFFWAGVHTRLADGSFYARGSQQNFLLPDFNVTSPTFVMPAAPATSVISAFCYAAPRESCLFYPPCTEETSTPEHTALAGLSVFPNPSNNGSITIQQSGSFTYEVIDALGQVVLSGNAKEQAVISVEAFADGMYFVRVMHNNASAAQKVVIEN
jgi:hypothetical protein